MLSLKKGIHDFVTPRKGKKLCVKFIAGVRTQSPALQLSHFLFIKGRSGSPVKNIIFNKNVHVNVAVANPFDTSPKQIRLLVSVARSNSYTAA